MTLRVLGVDPGTRVTGYGVVDPAPTRPGTARADGRLGRLVECGVIRTDPRAALSRRLETLYGGVCELIARHQPGVLALEHAFYAKNVRTTLTLGHARGVILLAAARAGLEVAEFAPRTIKKSVVGEGGAGKPRVGYMVQRLLRLQAPPTPNDAADGIAVALTYLLTGAGSERGGETATARRVRAVQRARGARGAQTRRGKRGP